MFMILRSEKKKKKKKKKKKEKSMFLSIRHARNSLQFIHHYKTINSSLQD